MGVKEIAIDGHHSIYVSADDDIDVTIEHIDSAKNLPGGAEPVGASCLEDASEILQDQIQGLAALGAKLRELATPDELQLETSLTFAGRAGIPILASGEAEAGLKLTLKWSRSQGSL